MSSRAEEKARARAEREAREAELAGQARRKRTLILLGAIAAAVVVVVVVAVLASGGGDDGASGGGNVEGASESAALFRGIPQQGTRLGNPNAPVTLTEFADLQCPFCAEYALQAQPQIIQQYVKTGKVRLEFRNLRFLGEDSAEAAMAAAGAGQQNKLYQFVDLFYRNQGEENTGYVDEEFLKKIAGGVPGLNVDEAVKGGDTDKSKRQIAAAEAQAQRFGINSTPSFLLQRRGQAPQPLQIQALTFDSFKGPIDQALGAAGQQ